MAFPRINVERALVEGPGTFPYVTSSAAGNSPFGRQLSIASAWQARSALRYVPGDPPPITSYIVDNGGGVLTNRRVRDPLDVTFDEGDEGLNNQSWMVPTDEDEDRGSAAAAPPQRPSVNAADDEGGQGVSAQALYRCQPQYALDGTISTQCAATASASPGSGQLLFPNAGACEDSCSPNMFPRLGENLAPLTPIFLMNIQQSGCRDCQQEGQPLSGRCWVLALRPGLATEGIPTVQPGLACVHGSKDQRGEGGDSGLPVEFHLVPSRLGTPGQNFYISPPAQPADPSQGLVRNGDLVQVVSRRYGTMVALGAQLESAGQLQLGFSQDSFVNQGNSLIWEFTVEAPGNQKDILKVGDAIRLRPTGAPNLMVSGFQGRGSALVLTSSTEASAFRLMPRTTLPTDVRQRLEDVGAPNVRRPNSGASAQATATEDNRLSWISITVIVTIVVIVILLGVFLFFWFRPDKKMKDGQQQQVGEGTGGSIPSNPQAGTSDARPSF